MAEKAAEKVAEKEEVVEETKEDSFDNAFDEAVADEGGEKPPTDEAVEPEGEAKEEPTPEEAKSEEKPVKEEPKEEAKPKEEAEPEKSEEGKPSYDDLAKQFADLEHKNSTLQGMYNSEVKKKAPAEEPKEEPEEKEEPEADFSGLTEGIGEIDSVKQAKKDYGDDIGKAFSDVASHITKNVMSEVTKMVEEKVGKISEVVKPIQEGHTAAVLKSHEDEILEAHPDYNTYVDSGELFKFIEAQSGLTATVYREVVENGKAADVIELVKSFRDEKGYVEKEPEDSKDEIDTEKLEDMEAVPNKKTPVTGIKGGADENDFDGAFDEAVNS